MSKAKNLYLDLVIPRDSEATREDLVLNQERLYAKVFGAPEAGLVLKNGDYIDVTGLKAFLNGLVAADIITVDDARSIYDDQNKAFVVGKMRISKEIVERTATGKTTSNSSF